MITKLETIITPDMELIEVVRMDNRHRDAQILRQAVVYELLHKGATISAIARAIDRDRKAPRRCQRPTGAN